MVIASICLGLILSLVISQRRDNSQQTTATGVTTQNNAPIAATRLDEIKRGLEEGTCLTIVTGAGLALIIFVATRIQIPQSGLFLFYSLGGIAILYGIIRYKAAKYVWITYFLFALSILLFLLQLASPQPQLQQSLPSPSTPVEISSQAMNWIIAVVSTVMGGILTFLFTGVYNKARLKLYSPKICKIGNALFWVISVTNKQGFLHRFISRESISIFDPVISTKEKSAPLNWMNKSGIPETTPNLPMTLGEGQVERLFLVNKHLGNKQFALGTSGNPPILDEGVFQLEVYLNRFLYEYTFVLKNSSTDFVLKGPLDYKKAKWYLEHPESLQNDGDYQETIKIA